MYRKFSLFVLYISILTPVSIFADTKIPGHITTEDPWSILKPKPSCRPNDKPKKIGKTETFKDGTKVELWCQGKPAQYEMKIIKKDGSIGYSGKCAYLNGNNKWTKTWRSTVVVDKSGNIIRHEDKELINTDFESRDTHNKQSPGINKIKTNKDSHWIYDHRTGKITETRTTHKAMWVIIYNARGLPLGFLYTVMGPSAPKKPFKAPFDIPDKTEDLSLYSLGINPPFEGDYCFTDIPDYYYTSPFPSSGISEGKPITVAIKIQTSNNKAVFDVIEAFQGKLFEFDMEYIGEQSFSAKYTLIKGPKDMVVGERDGLIQWTPLNSDLGKKFRITIMAQYRDATPITHSFMLPVKSKLDKPTILDFNVPTAVSEVTFDGTVNSMKISKTEKSLILMVSNELKTNLLLDLPRLLIDSKIGEKDTIFTIFVNNKKSIYKEIESTTRERIIEIPVLAGESEIKIMGTKTSSDLTL